MYYSFNQRTDVIFKKKKKKKTEGKEVARSHLLPFRYLELNSPSFTMALTEQKKNIQQWKNTFLVMNLHFTKEEATRAHSLIFLQYTKQLN